MASTTTDDQDDPVTNPPADGPDARARRSRDHLVAGGFVLVVSLLASRGIWAVGLRGRPVVVATILIDCTLWGALFGRGRHFRIGAVIATLTIAWLVFRFHPGVALPAALGTIVVIGGITFGVSHFLPVDGPAILANPKGKPARALAATTAVIGGFTLTTLAVTAGVAGVAELRERINHVTVEPIPDVPLAFGRYVALGDSYSAGEGVRPYEDGAQDDDDGGDDCHRSRYAYPRLLAAHLAEPTVADFRACSGALSIHLWKTIQTTKDGENRYGIQADPADPLPADTGLVTVTAGGNDVRFSRILQHCFAHERCLQRRFDPKKPMTGEDALPPAAPLEEWAEAMLPEVGRRLRQLFGELRRQAPQARIVALGYPPLFPSGPAPWSISDCAIVLRRVDEGERDGLVRLGRDLNQTIYAAAAASDVEFADPSMLWILREPCGTLGQLTNAAAPAFEDVLSRGTFHPTDDGQAQLAYLMACYLREFPEPRRPYEQIVVEGLPPFDTTRLVPAYGTIFYNISRGHPPCTARG